MNLTPEQLRQNAAAMIAYAEGKPVEWQEHGTHRWDIDLQPSWDFGFALWRPKPAWTLPDPPAGQQWHRTDWTEADLPEGWRPLMHGEYPDGNDEVFDGEWRGCRNLEVRNCSYYKTRTLRPLPTKPKLVPWDAPQDVPGPVCWIRRKSNPSTIRLIVGISLCDICDSQQGEETWASLAELCEHSTDRVTWKPCTKEVK